jgi:hypothetical protein
MSQVSSRFARPASIALALGVSSALVLAAAAPASAATRPRAQSVGRFLDGQLGSQTLEDVVDLKDARATNPGTVTDQNPLDVTVAKQGTVPLSGVAQLPGSGNTVHFGAVNQVAKARSTGYAYGAAGAVANSGGASLGGNNNAYPADASINLSASAVPTPGTLPLPGAGNLAALGSVSATIGAVSALASTPAGYGKNGSTKYAIASLKLTIASPALGGVLSQLGDALTVPTLPTPLGGVPPQCQIKAQVLSPISLDDGAITVDPTGSITVDFAKLVGLNGLPANTDLLDYLTKYLTSSSGLAKALQATLSGIVTPFEQKFATCVAAFPSPVGSTLQSIFDQFGTGQKALQDALSGAIAQLTTAAGGNPLAPLSTGLKSLLDIGVNVQPNGSAGTFKSALKATPDQATPVVSGQTIVRALEINLLPAAGTSAAVTLALANAAAGPSTAPAPAAPSETPVKHHDTQLPTGVPAGQGTHGGSPTAPLTLLLLGLGLAGAGALAWRLRLGRHGA